MPDVLILRNGSRGPYVKTLQKGMKALKIKGVGKADGIFGDKTEDAVELLQKRWNRRVGRDSDQALYVDGVAGPDTLGAYNALIREADKPALLIAYEPEAPPRSPVVPTELLDWVRVSTDVHAGGYSTTTLRADSAERFQRVVDMTHRLGGIVSSAGGRRQLTSKAGANRSRRSFHYVGRAHDLATRSGMQRPSDPFIVENIGDRRWCLWARSSLSLADLKMAVVGLPTLAVGEVVGTFLASESRGKTTLRTESVQGAFFNWSQLARSEGFYGIRARKSFFRGGSFGGSEWWHVQDQTGLVHGETTFGDELLRVYTPEQAEAFVYWNEAKGSTFGVDWG